MDFGFNRGFSIVRVPINGHVTATDERQAMLNLLKIKETLFQELKALRNV